MATTTAAISISSDIMDNAFSISNTATLTTAGTDTGLTETSGVARRTFATNAADNGVPIEKLKYIMGHTTIETTLIYYKISPEQIKQAIQSLESFYNS